MIMDTLLMVSINFHFLSGHFGPSVEMVTIHDDDDDDGYKSRRLLIINFDFYKTFSFTLLLLDLDYLDD
ncbi:hypothetical protein DERF_002115 [Dermatophagoides farinae]|uniref:Uncharacterized protein n=1 Tax=Dermatophagoides farinae TaxID=6954 RepID=A0A922L9B4_DERFA|nr:hypothetical protein DERF_002115 [Dermatophagoides farinae]